MSLCKSIQGIPYGPVSKHGTKPVRSKECSPIKWNIVLV